MVKLYRYGVHSGEINERSDNRGGILGRGCSDGVEI